MPVSDTDIDTYTPGKGPTNQDRRYWLNYVLKLMRADIARVSGVLTLANGLNSDLALPSPNPSWARLAGPTGAFSVGGFAGGTDGYRLTLYNTVPQTMTIINEDASSQAANRIKTLTGGNVVLRANATSSASLVYDITDTRWILVGTN